MSFKLLSHFFSLNRKVMFFIDKTFINTKVLFHDWILSFFSVAYIAEKVTQIKVSMEMKNNKF